MIREISLERLISLSQPYLCKKSPNVLLSRLCSNAKCFSKNSLCTNYELVRGEEVFGVMCRYASCATLCLFKKADLKELCDFLKYAPINILECEYNVGKRLYRPLYARRIDGKIMLLKKTCSSPLYKTYETENVSDFFNILKSSDPFYEKVSYEEYYCDVFYRNALPARLFLAEYEGKPAATAAVMHDFGGISIISDVCTHKALRCRGLASSVVSAVAGRLLSEGKTPTLLSTSKTAYCIYKKIGFRACERFCLLHF